MSRLAALWLPLPVFLVSCARHSPEDFRKLSEEFVYSTLAFSPSAATAAGLHQYQNRGLDDLLDDFSPAAQDAQRQFYADFRQRLSAFPNDILTAEDRADLAILQDQISLALLDLNEIHSAQHNPTLYVETMGNALFSPYVLEYAPKPARMRNIIARLEKVPRYFDQASTNLVSSPDIWTKVAIEENDGNIELVDKTIRAEVPAELKDAYTSAAAPAIEAMRKFQGYLKKDLSARNNADWRLGRDLYTKKFRYTLESTLDPETVLANAEAEVKRVRAHMLELALPLHRSMFPAHKDHNDPSSGDTVARENKVIGEVLDKIAERHSTREAYMDDARKDLEETRAFVAQKHLLTLPTHANLQVIPTPVFMQGIYSVGGFAPAPTLEPQLGAFYWVTPVSANLPKERAESKLREYNNYGLKLLTIHEAMPGHYVQFEFADQVQPKSRRVLRAVYGNGAYIEGYAHYATRMMVDEGYLDHSPELALSFDKLDLRAIANAILDVRLQMLHMTDQEAIDLMMKQTFQESEEASGKLQRAKLSSAQLPTYFVGSRDWMRVRDAYRQAKGPAFNLSEFHDKALAEGAVPLSVLRQLLQ